MEYESTKTNIIWEEIIGKIWVMYENMKKGKTSIENSSPLYQTYMPTVI